MEKSILDRGRNRFRLGWEGRIVSSEGSGEAVRRRSEKSHELDYVRLLDLVLSKKMRSSWKVLGKGMA